MRAGCPAAENARARFSVSCLQVLLTLFLSLFAFPILYMQSRVSPPPPPPPPHILVLPPAKSRGPTHTHADRKLILCSCLLTRNDALTTHTYTAEQSQRGTTQPNRRERGAYKLRAARGKGCRHTHTLHRQSQRLKGQTAHDGAVVAALRYQRRARHSSRARFAMRTVLRCTNCACTNAGVFSSVRSRLGKRRRTGRRPRRIASVTAPALLGE